MILDRVADAVRALPERSRALLVADASVHAIYGDRIERALTEAGVATLTLLVPPGEESKAREVVARLQDEALDGGVDRRSVVIALGGGVTGDLAGYLAATLLRGIDWIGVPTTLLAMVDSAVGGKTGVDTPAGKNLVGAFWHPAAVVADVSTLESLPERELRSGLAEVIKYGVILDAQLFVDLEDGLLESCVAVVPAALEHVVERCVTLKAEVVATDEREGNRRQILNFGHTVGHAVEAAGGYEMRHGEAVAIGMVAEARLAERIAGAEAGLSSRIADLCERAGLPTTLPALDPDLLLSLMRRDKKARDGKMRCALATDLGTMARVDDVWSVPVPERDLRDLLRSVER